MLGKYIVLVILLFQGFINLNNSDWLKEKRSNKITFKEFYAEEQFNEIKEFINHDSSSFKIASLGLHPSVAIYNKFRTIDGYASSYSLKYKHDFREIIEGELNRSKELSDYFDFWGSRCYLYSGELGKQFVINKTSEHVINSFQINNEKFKEHNGKYIISSVKLLDPEKGDMKFVKLFRSNISAWDIYLYEVL